MVLLPAQKPSCFSAKNTHTAATATRTHIHIHTRARAQNNNNNKNNSYCGNNIQFVCDIPGATSKYVRPRKLTEKKKFKTTATPHWRDTPTSGHRYQAPCVRHYLGVAGLTAGLQRNCIPISISSMRYFMAFSRPYLAIPAAA